MKSESEIRERIREYRKQQQEVAEKELTRAEERYAMRIVELEWVLDDNEF